jgi:hypothetical protein
VATGIASLVGSLPGNGVTEIAYDNFGGVALPSAGQHIITASDGTSTGSAQVTVQDTPPQLSNVQIAPVLTCDFKPERDSAILRSIPTLKTINDKPAGEFWKKAAEAAEEQVRAVVAKLKKLNPGFDGKETHTIEGGVVTVLEFLADKVTDISPVRALAHLKWLHCTGSPGAISKLTDLSPLKGMQLTSFSCGHTPVADLSPLKGMPLVALGCHSTRVADLSPLKGMKLEKFSCSQSPVADLSPPQGHEAETL